MSTAPVTERHPVTGKFRRVSPLTVARLVSKPVSSKPVSSPLTVAHVVYSTSTHYDYSPVGRGRISNRYR
jgi:hypothetical protein